MYFTLYANDKGEVWEYPDMAMLGRSGNTWLVPVEREMIPLPKGASLVALPGCLPVGLNAKEEIFCREEEGRGRKVTAVAALLPQGFTRTLLPAFVKKDKGLNLPLYGYAAVGFKDEKIYVAAVKTDNVRKWHPVYYNTEGLGARINKMLKKYPQNRILRQLAYCSLAYSCFTAQNIFYQRWEGGIPTMPACNAGCLGCISEEHAGVRSPQNRLTFKPTVEEISELGIEHLENAREGIISFGQGCEGEPSLNAKVLASAIKIIRKHTDKGTININTNAGYTEGIKMLTDAGLDAMRVTIFSCIPGNYNLYHRPKGYSLEDVKKSIRYAANKGVKVALNLLVFPGITDREEEIEALLSLVEENGVYMIQMRNLNIDPDYIMGYFPARANGIGMVEFINIVKKELPGVKIGSYTHPVR
ncbi:Radical SAM superfamily protein [Thermosyntropha lipolytica DSM 11003]|uniref:Radical SAM superfamily protein n=1 Tax=Thermosyntropha lipolytica DSM 11003 TaxID=1123382 RepID=A0A1M5RV65_9FIRM|nr:radical SAM protein [Thermosyntropha lipolytica]SHH30126.1 Radical SAM superfamily protein [Thermosyntropha lipolytica DSM 11003]